MQGLAAVLLSLEKVPVIRYQGFSELARRLAERVNVNVDFIDFNVLRFSFYSFLVISLGRNYERRFVI